MQVFRSASWLLLAQVISLTAPVLVIPVLTQVMSPEQFGTYALLMIFAGLLGGLVDTSFATAAIRMFVDSKAPIEGKAPFLVAAAKLAAISGIAMVSMAVAVVLCGDYLMVLKWVSALAPMLLAYAGSIEWYLISVSKVHRFTLITACSKLSLVLVVFLFEPSNPFFVVWLAGVFQLMAVLLVSLSLLQVSKLHKFQVIYPALKILKFSVSFWVARGGVELYRGLVPVILSVFSGLSVVGYFYTLERVATLFQLVQAPILKAVSPNAVSLSKSSEHDEYQRIILKAFRRVSPAYLIIAVGFFVSYPWLEKMLLSSESGANSAAISIFSISVFFGMCNYFWSLLGLQMVGKSFEFAVVIWSAGIVSIVFSMLFIPQLSLIGAVLSVLAGEVMCSLGIWLVLKRLYESQFK